MQQVLGSNDCFKISRLTEKEYLEIIESFCVWSGHMGIQQSFRWSEFLFVIIAKKQTTFI